MNPSLTSRLPRRTQWALRSLIAALCLGPIPTALFAQLAATAPAVGQKQPEAEEVVQLDDYVVTGTVTPRRQLESPVAITVIDRGRIDDLGPRNLAELFKAVPGIYSESTGGEAFNNVSARGVGTTFSFSYIVLHEDGLPVFAANALRQGPADTWTRVSTFVESVEALRSGTSNIFASQATLALINLVSREGGPVVRGETTLTISDYGTLRSDMWVSGPAGKNTTFALGGWYRVDDGVRYAGYIANKGGDLRGNLKHTLENGRGYGKVSFKIHEDRNVWDLPMPMTGGANFRSIPFGPDLRRDPTSASADQRRFSLLNTPVGHVNYDLADGIHSQINYIGTEVQYEMADGIKLENRNRYSDGSSAINYAFNGLPTPWQAIANAAARRDAAQFAAGLSGGNYSFRLTYPGQNNAIAAANAAAAAALGNGFGVGKALQHARGPITNFQNDLRVIGSFNDDRTTAMAGVYYSFLWKSRTQQNNTVLTDVTPSARRVDITILDAATGAPIGPATFNGIFHFGTAYRNTTGEDREISPYALVEHKMGPVSLDAGIRHKTTRQVVTREFTADTFVTANSINPALRRGVFGTGNFETRNNEASDTAYTIGANYAFSQRLAAYARVSRGVRTLGITELEGDVIASRVTSPSRILTSQEVGLKFGTGKIGVVATVYQLEIKGIQDTQVTFLPDGRLGPFVIALQNQESKGIELESIWIPLTGLSLGLNAALQDPKWTTGNLKTQTLSTGQVVVFNERGLTPERTPKVLGMAMASYQFALLDWGTLAINGAYQYTGVRPVDRANGPINPLTAYGETQVGLAFTTRNQFNFRVTVNNLFDTLALSEGDPRTGTNILDPTISVFNARPIQPRTITGSFSYRF